MANRDQAPNSAFACITEIKGKTHRLLRHHTADVQDGNEHDTVDVSLLKASLNLVEQLKESGAISEEVYEASRSHLQSHARTVIVGPQPKDVDKHPGRRDLENDPDMARRIVSEQASGPSGNQNLENPRIDEEIPADPNIARKAEEQLMQEGGKKGSITGKGSTPVEPAVKDTHNPAGVKGDIKHEVDKGPAGADVEVKKGKVAPSDKPKVSETDEGKGEDPGQHVDNGEQLVNNPNAAKSDAASTPTKKGDEPPPVAKPELEDDLTPEPKGTKAAEGEKNPMVGGTPKSGKKGDSTPTKEGEEPAKKAKPELEKDKQPPKKGKPNEKAEAKEKEECKKKAGSEEYGDMPEDKDKKDKKTPKEDKKEDKDGKKKVKSKSSVKEGDWVRNGQNFVGVVTGISKNGNPIVKVPAGHDQAIESHGWKVVVKASEVDSNDPVNLLRNEMRILNSPEALATFGQPTPEGQRARNCAIALASVEQITPDGRAYFSDLFDRAVAGKAVAKVESIDKLGSRELIDLKITDGPMTFYVMVEVFRDGDDKVVGVRMLQENLPVEVLKDFAGFLRNLAKEAPAVEKAEASEKLDRCVAKVKKQLTEKYRKKTGKEPSEKKRKEIESSAFAICREQGIK
jgi:hypothetical protein